jgi:hypothetical protein
MNHAVSVSISNKTVSWASSVKKPVHSESSSFRKKLTTELNAIPFSPGDRQSFMPDERAMLHNAPSGMLRYAVLALKQEPYQYWNQHKAQISEIIATSTSKKVAIEQFTSLRESINSDIIFTTATNLEGSRKWKEACLSIIRDRILSYIDGQFRILVQPL